MVWAVQFNEAIDSIIHYGQAKDVDIISVTSEPSTESGVKWDLVDTASNSSGLVPPPNTPNTPDSADDTPRKLPKWGLMEVSPNWDCQFQELPPAEMVPAMLAPPMGLPPLYVRPPPVCRTCGGPRINWGGVGK